MGSQIINILQRRALNLGAISREYRIADIIGVNKEKLDISNLEAIKRFVNQVKPNSAIKSAVYTNGDGCDRNHDLAFKVNSLGLRNLAIACNEVKAKLIISMEYVFQGNGTVLYKQI